MCSICVKFNNVKQYEIEKFVSIDSIVSLRKFETCVFVNMFTNLFTNSSTAFTNLI